MSIKSQNQEIYEYLQTGKSLTPLEALERFGCFRLGARIYDLKQADVKIATDIVEKNGKRFASYRLEK
jgi:hypothetical protein